MNNSWQDFLKEISQDAKMQAIQKQLAEEAKKYTIAPEPKNMFRVFKETPYDKVRVVVLAQDPYHGEGQANGLAFAIDNDKDTPPSLRNIIKEVEDNYGYALVDRSLMGWARQGVFLLNTCLSVRLHQPLSHQKIGWEWFTDRVIEHLSNREQPMVFMLWGAEARKKKDIIKSHHLILEAPHPSPLSAHKGFFGCKHFLLADKWLKVCYNGEEPIRWTAL